MIKIKLIYRNYKPLHQIYQTLIQNPPKNIDFEVNSPITYLKAFYPFYTRFGYLPPFKQIFQGMQHLLFDSSKTNKTSDIGAFHFAQMIPHQLPSKNFIVDFSHIVALANFQEMTPNTKEKILTTLLNSRCKFILPVSEAALTGLKKIAGTSFKPLESKIQVVYPCLPLYHTEQISNKETEFHIKRPLKILFVGTHVYRKGLHELLKAAQELINNKAPIELDIISDTNTKLSQKYHSNQIKFHSGNFSKKEIIKNYFLKSDLFVMPTHGDLFGMVFLDALSSGTPIITTRQFACPEIIRENETGLFVESSKLFLNDIDFPNRKNDLEYFKNQENLVEDSIVEGIINHIQNILTHPEKLIEMKKNCLRDFISNGKFSIQTRQNKMEEIYKTTTQL